MGALRQRIIPRDGGPRRSVTLGIRWGSRIDPAPDHLYFGLGERILLIKRHLAFVDHLEEQAFLGFSPDNHRAGVASLKDPFNATQIQAGLAGLLAVAADAVRLQNRLHVCFELRAARLVSGGRYSDVDTGEEERRQPPNEWRN